MSSKALVSSKPFRPVLLVPGWSDTARVLRRARAFLIDAGWPEQHVRCLDFHDRYGSNLRHATELESAIAALREDTGARSVDVVAHSMGGLALRWFLGNDPSGDVVRTVIFLGTPHAGTWAAWFAWGEGGREMRPGSEFLKRLAARPLPGFVRAHCLRTPIDTRVFPASSAWLDGTDCHIVRLPTHQRMLRHMPTLRLVRDLLLRP